MNNLSDILKLVNINFKYQKHNNILAVKFLDNVNGKTEKGQCFTINASLIQ